MAKCGRETEVYSRVCGYHRPVKNWNRGKQEEFAQRKVYNVPESVIIGMDMGGTERSCVVKMTADSKIISCESIKVGK